jgi:hypothetical protein
MIKLNDVSKYTIIVAFQICQFTWSVLIVLIKIIDGLIKIIRKWEANYLTSQSSFDI